MYCKQILKYACTSGNSLQPEEVYLLHAYNEQETWFANMTGCFDVTGM